MLYSGGAAPVQVTGAQCDIDMSGIAWGKVGVYSATVTPKTQGDVRNGKVATEVDIETASGLALTSTITVVSAERMNLAKGSKVSAAVKASQVILAVKK